MNEPPKHCGQIVLTVDCPTCGEYLPLSRDHHSLAATPLEV